MMNAIMKQIDNRDIGSMVTDHGMSFPDGITENEFFEIGHKLSEFEQGMQWAIGDWYNAIPWGDKKAACDEAGLNHPSAKTYGSVCGVFQMLMRINIPFLHHQILAIDDLTDPQRMGLLKLAETEELSSAKLKIERDKVLGRYIEPVRDVTTLKDAVAVATEGVPIKYKKKVTVAIENVNKRLLSDFNKEVTKQAALRMKKERVQLKEYRDELEQRDAALVKAFKNVNHILTLKEFKLIRSLLHPDNHPDAEKVRYQKAFNAFQKLLDNVDPTARKRWAD